VDTSILSSAIANRRRCRYDPGMYIRQIPGRARADGSRLAYLQLARKVRDPATGKVRDEVLHHFGRADRLDRAQIRRLIDSLARFLAPEERAAARAGLGAGGAGEGLAVERSLSLGGPHVLDAVWRRLGLDRALAELLAERAYEHDVERLLFALVANRALAPRSKLALERWVGRKVAIDGLPAVAVHSLYRAMDFLVDHGETLQRAVFFATASLLNLEVDLLFLDTTSVYVEADEEDEADDGLRRFGHSRDHRPDRPQVVVALAVTRAGLPVRCWTLPGNTADAAVVEGVQRDLAGWRLNRVVWVMDRGMAGRSQRAALQRGGGHVIVGEKLRAGSREAEAVLGRPGRYRRVRDNLEVKEVSIEHGSERRRFVLVRNPDRAERDRAKRQALLERLVAELNRLNAGRRGPGHSKAVCALKSHPAYGRFIEELADSTLRLDRARVRAEERLDGKYLLSTTDPSLSAAEVALGYRQLAEVARAFRTLKHELDLRPLHHRRDQRIRAHVLLCWLALLLVRVIEAETGASWARAREDLEDLALVTLKGKDGALEVATGLTPAQRNLLTALNSPPPRAVRTVTPPAAPA
jgi:hypothetical protein